MPFYIGPLLFKSVNFFYNAINAINAIICFPSFRSFADTSSLFLNKTALTAAISLACLEIRSSNEEAINFSRNRIYSLKDFSSFFIDVDTFYLFLN